MEWLPFWRDVSAAFLILQALILLAVPLVALYFSVRGMSIVLRKGRQYLGLVRKYVGQVENVVVRIMHALASPFIFVSSISAGLSKGLKSLWTGRK